MKRVYIAHPLTTNIEPWNDLERNFERYLAFCAMAAAQDCAVVSWSHQTLTHLRKLTQGDHGFYMKTCLALVPCADEIWLAGPLQVSKGMRMELECAEQHGLEVVQEMAWLDIDWWPSIAAGMQSRIPLTIEKLVQQSHGTAVKKGWWGPDGNDERNIGELLMLVNTELAEAMEDYREHGMAGLSHLTFSPDKRKPTGFPSELADVLVRVADICGRYDIDLNRALNEKLRYNEGRPFRHGGKHA